MGLLKKENKKQAITFRILSVEPKVGGEVGILSKIQATLSHIEADEETNQFQINIRIMIRLQKYGFDILFKPKELAKFIIEELGIIPEDDWNYLGTNLVCGTATPMIPLSVFIYRYMGNYIKFDVHLEADESIVKYITNLSKCVISI